MKRGQNKMVLDWKAYLPLILLFFAVAALSWAGVNLSGFIGAMAIAAFWFFIIPVINNIGIEKKVNVWFIRAGIFAIFAACFALIPMQVNPSGWAIYLIDLGYILSLVFGLIGVIYSLTKIH